MEVSVTVEGLDKLKSSTDAIKKAVAQEIVIALDASGKQVAAEAKRSLQDGHATGRLYKRRSVIHRASAPGEAPATDTGRLVNSIHTQLDGAAFTVWVIASTLYAALLEFGTRFIAARPYFHPALEKTKDWIRNRLAEAVNRGIARGKS